MQLREVNGAIGSANASEALMFPPGARPYILRKTSDVSDTRPRSECLHLRNFANRKSHLLSDLHNRGLSLVERATLIAWTVVAGSFFLVKGRRRRRCLAVALDESEPAITVLAKAAFRIASGLEYG